LPNVVDTVNLVGFQNNDSGSELEFDFDTPLQVIQNNLTDELTVHTTHVVAGAVVEYSIADNTICSMENVSSTGFQFQMRGLKSGSTTVTAKL
jgi:hypothetical protein